MLSPTRRVSATAVAGLVAAVLAVPALSSPAAAVTPAAEPGCTIAAPVTETNSDPQAIDDFTTIDSSVTVAATGQVAWVRVQTDITHTYSSDLEVTLIGPSGRRVVITNYMGDSYDDVFDGTWWEDDAGDTNPPGSSYQATYTDGVAQPVLAPLQALANFRGEAAAGNWTLEVTDNAGADVGSLDGWTLEVATYSGAAASTVTVNGTPGTTGQVAGDTQATFTSDVATPVVGTVESAVVNLDAATVGDSGGYLGIQLVSPAGTAVTLTTDGWSDPDDYGFADTTFADDGVDNGTAWYVDGAYDGRRIAPLEPFSAFRGDGVTGRWRLLVDGEGGPVEVTRWSLALVVGSCGQDTRLTPSASVDHVSAGGTVAYAVTASNRRASAVSGAHAVLAVPAGTQLVGASASQGTCSGADCALGVLEGGASASVVYLLKTTTPGVVKPSVTLTQSGGDLAPADNAVAFSTTVDPQVLAPDTTKPGVVVLMSDADLAKVAKKGVPLLVGASEAGKLKVTLKLPGKTAKALGLKRTIGKASLSVKKPGTFKLTLKVAKKNRAALAASKKPVKLIVKTTLTDAAGNVGKSTANHTYSR
jgi:subtilisin-like proprotein convertase family protein